MRHIKKVISMDMAMHQQNNINFNVCDMCNTKISFGIVRDNQCYCNNNCYTSAMFFNTMAQPSHPTSDVQSTYVQPSRPTSAVQSTYVQHRKPYRDVPDEDERSQRVEKSSTKTYSRMYGKCATCRNTYNCKNGSIDMGDKWFCGKTCSQIYNSGNNVSYPATAFPCVSTTTYTMFPLSVNARTGKIVF